MVDIIEQQIVDKLSGVQGKANIDGGLRSELPWTKYVKQAVVDVGRSNGFKPVASGCNSDVCEEWLYDVVWYQRDERGNMRDVPLVMECEWGSFSAIRDDFEKLIVARTRYRVMIFQTETDAKAQASINLLSGYITNCTLSRTDDRYLFIAWARNHWASPVSYVVS